MGAMERASQTLGACQRAARVAQVESARIEGILLQQSRMLKSQPSRPATQYGSSSGSGVQRKDATSTGAMQAADEKPPEAPDVETGAEDSCEAQVKRAKTIMGPEMCVVEAQDDVYDETPGTPTNPAETSGENATDEDVVGHD